MFGVLNYLDGIKIGQNRAEDLVERKDVTLEELQDADDVVADFKFNNEKVVEL